MRLRHSGIWRQATAACLVMVLVVGGVLPYMQISKATAAGSESIWPDTAVPALADANDNGSVELGVKFQVAVSGTVTGVRFYKGPTNLGTHVGHLWSATGTKLAEVLFSGESASGWQTATFATPIGLTPNTTYVASYLAPAGQYAVDAAPSGPANLSAAAVSTNGNITALASGASGGNGVYKYTSAANGAFPNATFHSSNYWVDVLFNPGGVVPPPPPATSLYSASYLPEKPAANDASPVTLGVRFQSQIAGYISGIRFYKGTGNNGTHVGSLWTDKHTLLAQATFTGETSSGWQDVQFSDMVPIAPNTTYIASYFAPQGHYAFTSGGLANGLTNAPLVALPGSAPGGNGVYSYGIVPQTPLSTTGGSDYAVDIDFTPTYIAPTTQPSPRAGTTGSGSVLVLTDPTNHFSDNYCSALLSTKGIPCAATDTGNLTSASVLSPYKTVILADGAPLTSQQVTLLTAWINDGGNFIAMRPADNLASLLGLGTRSAILPDAYLKIDTTQAPGEGIDGQTLQYHGVADERALTDARAVATLYTDASTASAFPAVTTRSVGNGSASAWLFDLARSVVYTREGNPGLAGTKLISSGFDGNPRVVDRFALGYLDITKASVPQADLQVTLLANQVETTAFPTPLKWAFPSYQPNANHPGGLLKAAFVLTGDDHRGSSQTLNRFASETAASPSGCTAEAWTCIRSTSYAYPGAFSDATAKPYTDAGFEVSLHAATNNQCAAAWTTQAQLDSIFSGALSAWQASYPTINQAHPPLTERFHCYGVWNDYATIAKIEAAHGINADMNSSCWPNNFLNVGQCLFTGSGLPQKIADSDGTLTSVNQFTTQATDENPSSVDQTALTTLVNNAIGSTGYYGYFTVLAHLDNLALSNQTEAAVVSIATSKDIPVISGAQAQTFWNARALTTISNPTYAANSVTFSVGTPAANLLLLQPTKYGDKTLTAVKRGSTTIPYVTQTINGLSYAVFPAAAAGSYVATYN